MRCKNLLPLAAAFLLAGPLSAARAGRIEWDYGAFVLPSIVRPDEPHILPVPWTPPSRSDTGIVFIPRSGEAVNSSYIVLANLRSLSVAKPFAPDLYEHVPFELTLGIHDHESGKSDYARFTGYVDGTLSGLSSRLKFTFPVSAKTLHIGHNVYNIKLTQVTTPGLPLAGMGAIGARVTVHSNPEPGTLVLAGMAAPALAWWGWRRRRRTPVAA
jgi:hypothetical protein